MRLKIFTVLVCLILTLVFSGCEQFSKIENNPGENEPAEQAEVVDTKQDVLDLFTALISRPELVPNEIPDEIISSKYANMGLLQIYYQGEQGVKYKLQVIKDDSRIVYDLFGDGRVESFSLQYGSGEYTVRIMENIRDDEYFAVESETFSVVIDDDIAVYLSSIQNIDWDYSKLPIEDVPYIVSDSLTDSHGDLLYECADDLYFYVAKNIDYDFNKIDGLPYNYLPDIEQTYTDQSGLCYDYASLFASMMRSIGVPTKLVKGYASYDPDVYHAWVEVYIEGRWMILDPTQGSGVFGEFVLKDAEKAADDYMKVHEY